MMLPIRPDSWRKRGPTYPFLCPSQGLAPEGGHTVISWNVSGQDPRRKTPAVVQHRTRAIEVMGFFFPQWCWLRELMVFRRLPPANLRPAWSRMLGGILSFIHEATFCYFSILCG